MKNTKTKHTKHQRQKHRRECNRKLKAFVMQLLCMKAERKEECVGVKVVQMEGRRVLAVRENRGWFKLRLFGAVGGGGDCVLVFCCCLFSCSIVVIASRQ